MQLIKLSTPPVDSEGNPLSGIVSIGGGYYDTEPRAVLPADAVALSTGYARFLDAPAADRANVLRASVYRAKDGTSLRARANTAAGGSLPSKVPATGATSARPSPTANADAVRARAIQYVAEGTAVRLIVTMAEIRTGDVVGTDTLIPHRWLGESESNS